MSTQYDAIAADYQQTRASRLREELETPCFLSLIGDPRGLRVLDLGCGDGYYSRLLAQRGAARVVGVDVSGEMLAMAAAAEQRDPLGIEYLCSDVAALPDLGEFDLIAGTYLLHYAPNEDRLRNMCARIAAHLSPGGRFVALNENPDVPQEVGGGYARYGFSKTLEGEARSGTKITYRMIAGRRVFSFNVHYYSGATYETALRDAGFQVIQWHPLTRASVARSEDEYFAAYLATPPIILLECSR